MADLTEKNIIIDDKVITEMIAKINTIRNNVEDDFNKISSLMNKINAAWSDESTVELQSQFAAKKSELPKHLENLDACKKELERRLERYSQEFVKQNIKEVRQNVN